LGGKLFCNTRAERVIVENGRGVGVSTQGERLDADAVIVSADAMAIDYLFDDPLQSEWLNEMRADCKPMMVTFICLGIDADLQRYPKNGAFKLKEPTRLADQIYEYLNYNNYGGDPVYSQEDKTSLTIQLPGDTYDFWKKAKEQKRYDDEKQKIAALVIAALAEHMPESDGRVEVSDVATSPTYERYCASWKGSWMTEMSPNMKLRAYPSVIKGLDRIYFAGHRMLPPGGLPMALVSGRSAVQYLCRDTGTQFVSEG
jgi:phytoene dehydrogenase-like protein